MDSEMLASAQELRNELVKRQAAAVRQLQKDLEEADFFRTRGGFERVAVGADELLALYGKQNFEGPGVLGELQTRARERLDAIDGARREAQKKRLGDLADAFSSARQEALEQMVQKYIEQHLGGK
jgi:hypothetical protein